MASQKETLRIQLINDFGSVPADRIAEVVDKCETYEEAFESLLSLMNE